LIAHSCPSSAQPSAAIIHGDGDRGVLSVPAASIQTPGRRERHIAGAERLLKQYILRQRA